MERFRSVEVLLRVLAFGDRRATYDGTRKVLEFVHHERMDVLKRSLRFGVSSNWCGTRRKQF